VKAKEYIVFYGDALRSDSLAAVYDAVGAIFKGLMEDAIRIAMARCGKPRPPDTVMLPCLREQDQKWRAICAAVPGMDPNGFREMMVRKGIRWD